MGSEQSNPNPQAAANNQAENDFSLAINMVNTYVDKGATSQAKEKLGEAKAHYEKFKSSKTRLHQSGFESRISTAQNRINNFGYKGPG